MTSIKETLGKGILDDVCPHCGEPLLSRHARRQHLTLRVCQQKPGEFGPPWDERDVRHPPEWKRQFLAEEAAAEAERRKDKD
ncbi:hypothetical protein [Breoghania sp. L-A4]|uniref:hypothetical protein n=1 Tax=Breoghania sp. L-A4 TaxID=2304600 RepID=UPI000E35D71D|nr:hypothetical protein [Breoghania sp. L-A4]AXS40854.1 hypothetical protein D1F64_13390 [Breoghania sp. L-A4]